MAMSDGFDLIVLGAGPAGVQAARQAAQGGRRVALVESGRVGGTSVMRGCLPMNLLLAAAGFASDLADSLCFGWTIDAADFDWPRLVAAKNAELARLETLTRDLLRDEGVVLVEGRGRLAGPGRVAVAGEMLAGAQILIATGCRPALPDVPGIAHAVTSDRAIDLMQLPDRAVIVGGGPVGCEFAGLFARLGVRVDMVLRGARLLPAFDADLAEALAEDMAARGVVLHRHATLCAIEGGAGGARARVEGAEGAFDLDADLVLAATGRRPNADDLGLEALGVRRAPDGAVAVDSFGRSSVDGIWAVGEVAGAGRLTPVAVAEARAFVRTAFDGVPSTVRRRLVPSAVQASLPLAAVGLTEEAARAREIPIDVHVARFRPWRDFFTAGGEGRGLAKLVVARDSGRVLGIHILGPGAAEVIQGFAVALAAGATREQVEATLGIHPTAAEALIHPGPPRPEPPAAAPGEAVAGLDL